jgi:uncharacterized protein (DUF2225 family)
MADEKELENGQEPKAKVSFLAKEELTCPACGAKFHREELLSGGGRLIAGNLTDELHRLYEPSAKYGKVYPLVYQASVCPECLFASMEKDFSLLPPDAVEKAKSERDKREHEISLLGDADITGAANFHGNRRLFEGAVSQYLVLRCYDYFPLENSPTIKQGVAALRAGWLCDHLNEEHPGRHFDWLAVLFKKKAAFCYTQAIKRETAGVEKLSALENCGPDTDKNYAYEGILYVAALLDFKYGDRVDGQRRYNSLDESKRSLGRIFGLGKSSKAKPGPLLEKAKTLYQEISVEMGQTDY